MSLRTLTIPLFVLLMILLVGCAPPTGQQLEDYERYAAARATDAAASQIIAAARATEAAAADQMARLTAEALGLMAPITATSTVTPSAVLTSTALMTITAELTATTAITSATALTGTAALTATTPITSATPLTATAGVTISAPAITATVAASPTAPPTATPSLAPSPSPTALPTSTFTATPLPTATPTGMPSPSATATPTSSPTETLTATPTAGRAESAVSATVTTTMTPTAPLAATQMASAATATAQAFAAFAQTTTPTATTLAAPSTPTPTPAPVATVVVSSQRANVRSGPGMEFDVVGSMTQGAQLGVLGRNDNSSWWYVCCADERPGWVSNTVVQMQGDPKVVPVQSPLIPDDLQASWAIRWQCHAEGCKQDECLGNSRASALRVRTARWLEVKREATWENACGENEDWLTDVDRYSGKEQQNQANQSLFAIWAGQNPGPETRRIELLDKPLSLWCTGTRTREVQQSDGWTIVYEGEACYDRAAGVLATLQYVKRWLYTGTFGGQQYDRQYFGDYEIYQQVLTGVNAPLSGE